MRPFHTVPGNYITQHFDTEMQLLWQRHELMSDTNTLVYLFILSVFLACLGGFCICASALFCSLCFYLLCGKIQKNKNTMKRKKQSDHQTGCEQTSRSVKVRGNEGEW